MTSPVRVPYGGGTRPGQGPGSRPAIVTDRSTGGNHATSGSGGKGGRRGTPSSTGGGLVGQIGDAYGKPLDFSGAQSVQVGDTASLPSISSGGGVDFTNAFDPRFQNIQFTNALDPRFQNVQFQRGTQGVDFLNSNALPGSVVQDRGGLAGRLGGMFGDLSSRTRGLDSSFGLGTPDSFGDERSSVEQAVFDRSMNLLRPEFERQESRMQTDLVNRGLAPTTEAYTDQYRNFEDRRGRTLNDLSLAAVQAGAQEHQRLADLTSRNRQQVFGEDMGLYGAGLQNVQGMENLNMGALADRAQQANEANARAQQQLGLRGIEASEAGNIMNAQLGLRGQQLQGTGMAADQQLGLRGQQLQGTGMRAQQQEADQQRRLQAQIAARQAALAAQQQRYQQQMALRQQQISEQMAKRTQPTNDLLSLLSGTAPGGTPTMPQLPQYAIQAPDLLGLTGSNYAAAQGAGAAKAGARNQMLGGLMGGIGSAVGGLKSDRRLKRDIRRIGRADNGLPIYSFRYTYDSGENPDLLHIGFIADEVEKVRPEAVSYGDDGFAMVDYWKAAA